MNKNSSLSTLITQYQTLCQYCDDMFTATFHAYHPHMQCAKGCASCCLLETVVPLEAFMITSYLKNSAFHYVTAGSDQGNQVETRCVFLNKDICSIYPVRPIICRTHGLPLIYPEKQAIETCPLNFTEIDLRSIEKKFLLDVESITVNLLRVNLAFCFLTQQTETAGDRIPLQRLIIGKY